MSERFRFACPGCQKMLAATTRYVGRKAPCPACGQPVVVPPDVPEEQGPVLVAYEDQGESKSHFALQG